MNSIIVGTDFSEGSYVALEVATDIARALKADIKLVWVQQERILVSEQERETLKRLSEEKMRDLCEKHREQIAPMSIHYEVLHGRVSSVLADQARKEKAQMIVIGTNGASGFEKYWMGSTAVRIVQEAPCPTLSIRQGFNFHKSLEHIVVPIRVSTSSREKIRPASMMARIFGSHVHILGLQDIPAEEQTLHAYMKQSADYLEAEHIPHTMTVRKSTNACDTILSYAYEINADLLVIHTEQDKFVKQLFLGTNAQQIVHKSQIPVLSLHPEDYINFAR
ncbi:MAG: UspA domain-containing protein [bacterium P3]|nr:MAG: UspA domain-containing protein [bacterium P3]KWW42446.1 MAG: UspA domain-containing protein [bacterium F083]